MGERESKVATRRNQINGLAIIIILLVLESSTAYLLLLKCGLSRIHHEVHVQVTYNYMHVTITCMFNATSIPSHACSVHATCMYVQCMSLHCIDVETNHYPFGYSDLIWITWWCVCSPGQT